jgi:hypothetical protein
MILNPSGCKHLVIVFSTVGKLQLDFVSPQLGDDHHSGFSTLPLVASDRFYKNLDELRSAGRPRFKATWGYSKRSLAARKEIPKKFQGQSYPPK